MSKLPIGLILIGMLWGAGVAGLLSVLIQRHGFLSTGGMLIGVVVLAALLTAALAYSRSRPMKQVNVLEVEEVEAQSEYSYWSSVAR